MSFRTEIPYQVPKSFRFVPTSGTPTDTLHLKAGMPYIWSVSPGYFTIPFSANVTAWYYTNSTAATTLTGRILTS